jgi:hypothetical protein
MQFLGSSIAVAASFWLIFATDLVNQSGVLAYIVGALVYSSVTGLVLAGLLAYTDQSRAKVGEASKPSAGTAGVGEGPLTRYRSSMI